MLLDENVRHMNIDKLDCDFLSLNCAELVEAELNC